MEEFGRGEKSFWKAKGRILVGRGRTKSSPARRKPWLGRGKGGRGRYAVSKTLEGGGDRLWGRVWNGG